jgi:YVTN family beta-propeller protein
MKKFSHIFLIFIVLFSLSMKAQMNDPSYAVVNKFHLPGDGGWDYLNVDASRGWLFVSHGTMVQVMDVKSGKVTGTIPNTPGVHGIALAPEFNKGFISNGKDTSVTIFDYKTLAFIARIKVTGQNPDAIMYDDFSKRVFVYNGRSANATVIDAKTDAIIATIPLEGKPEFSVTDGAGKIYVNIEDKNLVDEINATTMKVEHSWPISPGEEPSGLALDNETHRLFSVCSNKLMVILDATNGNIITTLPIGDGCDGVKFDPYYKTAFSSNGEGSITVVLEKPGDKFSVLETVTTQAGARTLAIDEKTHRIYLPTAEFGPAPEPTAENPRPRKTIKPDTFVILEVAFIK